jgi:transcriptional regulator with XRE-family HTH domain
LPERDFLDEIIAGRKNPHFAEMVEAASARRRMLRTLAAERVRRGLSQTTVAALMGTSQSAVARLEAGETDLRFSTVERYAATLNSKIEWQVVPARRPRARRRVKGKR